MNPSTAFATSLETALEHYQEPAWLGEHSPLASPYFLGDRLKTSRADAGARGRALQALLAEATAQIEGKYQDRYQTILREYYFANRPVAVVSDQVGLGKNSFHLSRNAALAALAEQVIRLVRPALRLESPPQSVHLWERSHLVEAATASLAAGATVLISGPAGLGKTALASHLARQYPQPSFWYTIRPGLTDQLDQLLFALGYFLQQLGAPGLWLELVAAPAQLAGEKLLGLARHALTQLQPGRPLLCIDEIDLLRPPENPAHAPLLAFIGALHGLTPLLLIGQQPALTADHYLTLPGLSAAALREWLHARQLSCSFAELTALHQYTQGNPALIQLALALLSSGLPPSQLVANPLSAPALDALLSRMLPRLSEPARRVLLELTVYGSPAPSESWQNEVSAPALHQLLTYGLVQQDEMGGLLVAPIYRAVLYQLLPAEQRTLLHARAAQVYESRGMITAAVAQLIQADQAEAAIWLWRDHQQAEIEQGQARTARDLLRGLTTRPLAPPTREALALALAALERFTGDLNQARQEIQTLFWQTPLLAVEADELLGVIANDHSDFAAAEHALHNVLQRSAALLEVRRVQAHKGLAWLHLRQRALDQAEAEALRAQYEAENIRGNIHLARYQYDAAIAHYQQALALAAEVAYQEGLAKTYNNLGQLYSLTGQLAAAQAPIQAAAAIFTRLGNPSDEIGCQITLAVMHNLAGEHDAAVAKLTAAQLRLAALPDPPPWLHGLLCQAQAEAYLGLGELEKATAAAQEVIAAEEGDLLPDAYRTYGEILSRLGQVTEAASYLRLAIQLAEHNEDHYLCAYGWRALGKHYLSQRQNEEGQAALQQAIELFVGIALPNEVTKTQALSGGNL